METHKLSFILSAVAARPALILDIPSDREEFSHMIRLCKDPAILGNRLLEEVTQLAGSETAQNKQGKPLLYGFLHEMLSGREEFSHMNF